MSGKFGFAIGCCEAFGLVERSSDLIGLTTAVFLSVWVGRVFIWCAPRGCVEGRPVIPRQLTVGRGDAAYTGAPASLFGMRVVCGFSCGI